MPTITAEQSRSIAKLYSDLASALTEYRFAHWTELTRAQRAEIESHEWTLLTYSSNMATRAIRLGGADVATAVAGITRATPVSGAECFPSRWRPGRQCRVPPRTCCERSSRSAMWWC